MYSEQPWRDAVRRERGGMSLLCEGRNPDENSCSVELGWIPSSASSRRHSAVHALHSTVLRVEVQEASSVDGTVLSLFSRENGCSC